MSDEVLPVCCAQWTRSALSDQYAGCNRSTAECQVERASNQYAKVKLGIRSVHQGLGGAVRWIAGFFLAALAIHLAAAAEPAAASEPFVAPATTTIEAELREIGTLVTRFSTEASTGKLEPRRFVKVGGEWRQDDAATSDNFAEKYSALADKGSGQDPSPILWVEAYTSADARNYLRVRHFIGSWVDVTVEWIYLFDPDGRLLRFLQSETSYGDICSPIALEITIDSPRENVLQRSVRVIANEGVPYGKLARENGCKEQRAKDGEAAPKVEQIWKHFSDLPPLIKASLSHSGQ